MRKIKALFHTIPGTYKTLFKVFWNLKKHLLSSVRAFFLANSYKRNISTEKKTLSVNTLTSFLFQCLPRLPPVWNGLAWAVFAPKGLIVDPSKPWFDPKVDWFEKSPPDVVLPPNGFGFVEVLNMLWLAGAWGFWAGTCWGTLAVMAALAWAKRSFPTNGEGPVEKFEVAEVIEDLFDGYKNVGKSHLRQASEVCSS